MKKILIFVCALFVISSLSGCSGKAYEFKRSVDKIESIEIVSAKSSLDFTVIRTLSETEKNYFIEEFLTIEFNRYILGDPLSVSGNAVKITYKTGDYEMICHSWAEYVKNGEVYFVSKSCDEEEFNKLLNRFLEG